MSIMSDARLRLLESRVAEMERRLAERSALAPDTPAAAAPKSPAKAERKSAPTPRQPNRKTP